MKQNLIQHKLLFNCNKSVESAVNVIIIWKIAFNHDLQILNKHKQNKKCIEEKI